jgi:hypothetical protein
MKKWSAGDWCLVILASTIPISIIIIPVQRLLGGAPLSDNASSVINNLLTAIGVGLIGIMQAERRKPDGNRDEDEEPPLVR